MNTLKVEVALAKKYGYKPLPDDLSEKYRNYFTENIPAFLDINGSKETLYTINGTPICKGYDRIVVGDYGAFIEFSKSAILSNFVIERGQEYRVNDEKYAKNVKYIWLTIRDNSHIKIYQQKHKVAYADYRPRKYYISVHEVMLKQEEEKHPEQKELLERKIEQAKQDIVDYVTRENFECALNNLNL